MALAVAKPAAAKRRAETFMVGNDLEKMTGSVTGGGKNGEDSLRKKSIALPDRRRD